MLKQIVGTLAIAMGTTLTSCEEGSSRRNAGRYMQNKPQTELNEVIKHLKLPKTVYSWANTQSKLDSVAYRDIFNQTKAANDSLKIKEFNALAAKGKMEEGTPHKKLVFTNIPINEYDKIIDDARKIKNHAKYHERIQYTTDSINYRKFFNRNRLLTGNLLDKFNAICKQIKP